MYSVLALYRGTKPDHVKKLEDSIRRSSLRFHIKETYNDIRMLKHQLYVAKNELHSKISDQFLFHEVICTAEEYNSYIRSYHKQRLQCKYNWLLSKYYRYKYHGVNTIQKPPKSIPTEHLVTVLNVDEHPIELDQNETSLLSLGLGFAVTPKIDDKLIHNIEIN